MTRRKFYDTDEFKAERDKWYAKLADEGFEDCEILDKKTGHPSTQYLSGALSSTVTTDANPELEDEHRFPGGINKFHVTPRMTRYQRAERFALAACRQRKDWETCASWAMYADGVTQVDMEQILGRGAVKIRSLLAPLKDLLKN